MLTWAGLAMACAGPTAAPTVTALIASAAAMATSVRENCVLADMLCFPLMDHPDNPAVHAVSYSNSVPIAQFREKPVHDARDGGFSQPRLGEIRQPRCGTFAAFDASRREVGFLRSDEDVGQDRWRVAGQ